MIAFVVMIFIGEFLIYIILILGIELIIIMFLQFSSNGTFYENNEEKETNLSLKCNPYFMLTLWNGNKNEFMLI